MSKIRALFSNEYVFALITRFANLFFAIAQSICMARYLGPSLKGNSAYISSVVGIGSVIITFGIHQAYPFFKKKYGNMIFYKRYISLVYAIYSIYFLISISLLLFNIPLDIKMSALIMPLMGYNCVITYICLIENPNKKNKISLFVTLIYFLITIILFIFTSSNYFWMIILLVVGQFIEALYLTYRFGCKPLFDKKSYGLLKELLKFGFYPMLALLMTTLNYKIDVLMLKNYQFITYSMIGIYSIGIGLADKIVVIPDTMKGVLVSKLSKGATATEVSRICSLCLISGILLFLVLALTGNWLIDLLYGIAFSGAYKVVIITALGVVFIGYFKLIAQYNIVNGKQIKNVQILSVAIIVNIIGNMLLVPHYGIYGAAIATSLGNCVCGIVFIIYFSKTTKIPVKRMFYIDRSDLKLVINYFKHR